MLGNVRGAFRSGYIINGRADLVWFIALPFIALGFALFCQSKMTVVALASVSLWITVPHHYATWVRAFGIAEDRKRWLLRLVVGPIIIFTMGLTGLIWAPITTLLLGIFWDHQHSIMQQHGFARIYDFKAKTGTPSTGKFDFYLNWILFGNLFLTSPFFTPIWLKTLYRLNFPLSVETVHTIHNISMSIVVVYSIIYVGHIVWSIANGYQLNPIKYLFIIASYFLWYYSSWHTHSVLIYTIAHRIMHGIQYIVIAYVYTRRRSTGIENWAAWLVRPGHLFAFCMCGLFYALCFQLITNQPMNDIGFGLFRIPEAFNYPLDHLGLGGASKETPYALFTLAVSQLAALTHYYFDSFIWKVRDSKTREGL